MSGFTSIELEKLPIPFIIEGLDYESILTEMLLQFRSLAPQYTNILESDPVYKVFEVAAYRELLLRQRINDAAKGVMLAYAQGNDLEHLAAFFGVERMELEPGDEGTYPPIPPTYETDVRLRQRTQLALEGFSTAGSTGSYVYWSLSASGQVRDIDVDSPVPGRVVVTVLSTEGDGIPNEDLLDAVRTTLNAEEVRPLTDEVIVQAAQVQHYLLEADMFFYAGPDSETVLAEADKAVKAYCQERWRLGNDVSVSGLHAALHQPGVQRVELRSPADTLVIESHQAAYCDEFILNNMGIDE